MDEIASGVYLCRVCKTTKTTAFAAPVIRSAISSSSSVLFVGSFLLLLLATVLFDAFPNLEIPLTWTALYSLYLVYFGLAFANFRRKVFNG